MRPILALPLLLLSCVPFGNYRAVPSVGVGYNPQTGDESFHAGMTLAPGFHMDAESKEIFRGTSGDGGGRTEGVLREQIGHLETDVIDLKRERDEAVRVATAKSSEVSKLKVDLASAQDYRQIMIDWGWQVVCLILLIVGLFGWLIAKNWPRKVKA